MLSAWSKDFEIGIDIIDRQHQELFRLLRDLEQMVLTKCTQYDYKNFISIISEIREYATYHFYEEEKLMEAVGYKGLEEHKKRHREFEKYIYSISYTQLEKDPLPIIKGLRTFVTSWIMNHILIEDMKLKSFSQVKESNKPTPTKQDQ